jgi:ABC-2 type transport system permease protein
MNFTQYRALLRVTVEKRFNLFRRYLFNSVFGVVSLFLLFVLALFGGQQVAPTVIDGSKSGLVVGFFVWTMAVAAYNDISQQIETEAEWGTLEQLSMSPFGIGTVVFVNSLVYVAGGLVSGVSVLVLMLFVADVPLSIPPGVIPVGLLAVFPVVGLGLLLGGLTLIYKRVQAVGGIIQLGFVAFIALPLDAHPLVAVVPLTLETRLLETTMQAGTITAVQPSMLAALVAKSVGFLVVGFGAFYLLQREARRRGVLGQY